MEYVDGSKFESFVCRWLHRELNWSIRKATHAAHKLPNDWEDQCKKAALQKAYLIKEYDIPASLFINADQTQKTYAPGDKMTWAETGSSQVLVVRAEEKRAFTILVGVTANSDALPFQAVYGGKSSRSLPSQMSPALDEARRIGIELVFSGTDTYWSNHATMHQYVKEILVPHIEKIKQELNLPSDQKTLWSIEVWSVHRSQEFQDWMKENYPHIILDYIPGGCTGVAQPCDVGIQCPLKLLTKQSYHEYVVNEFEKQIKSKKEVLTLDDRLQPLRDSSVQWLVNAYLQ
ncbi:hypothetical protein BT96DRAFT_836425 [Gymnopus androsaceus JB14]|uniref:DDE-1 domain-containing protein n=1 Tax=Gymnopus androsaceus JB14 TaxID=1447944 RepID=A0A6A4GS95_9AGAR|nr:hypothetical protein BT96DRAFT_836425 [Gymnopus androsaceus JB14]